MTDAGPAKGRTATFMRHACLTAVIAGVVGAWVRLSVAFEIAAIGQIIALLATTIVAAFLFCEKGQRR